MLNRLCDSMKFGKKSLKKILIIAVLALVLSLGSFTLAKYVIEEFHSYYLNAKNFYFTSNRLKKSNPIYLINNWSGVGSFDISFDLTSVKNSYVHSNYDIPYTVTELEETFAYVGSLDGPITIPSTVTSIATDTFMEAFRENADRTLRLYSGYPGYAEYFTDIDTIEFYD